MAVGRGCAAHRLRCGCCCGKIPDKALGVSSYTGSNRVNRGGSWNNDPQNCRVANRNNDDPGNRNNNLGFRLANTASVREGVISTECTLRKSLSRCWSCILRKGIE